MIVERRLVLGIDFSHNDEPIIGVMEKNIDGTHIYINTLTGAKAVDVYKVLMGIPDEEETV